MRDSARQGLLCVRSPQPAGRQVLRGVWLPVPTAGPHRPPDADSSSPAVDCGRTGSCGGAPARLRPVRRPGRLHHLSETRDPEEVRDLLTRYFETCRRLISLYGGSLEKFIGDAVIAVWGAPVAQEGDAERAVRAALDLLNAVSELG